MKIPFMDLSRMHNSLRTKIDSGIKEVIDRGDFILGKKVEEFEKSFAKYCGVKDAAGISTGTDAIELALRGFNIGQGDEVITAPNSFIATASAISSAGAKPVFADVQYDSGNLDPDEIKKYITNKTKAIIPVHLYGHPADMDEILDIAKKYDLKVIEDACQAHGATYKGKKVGSLGDVAAFSFYPAKNLGCFGDGGIVVSENKDLIDEIKMLRNYGQSQKYHHDFFAFNKRLDTIQAMVLNIKLPYLDNWNDSRIDSAKKLNEGLIGIVETPEFPVDRKPVYHLYAIIVGPERDELQNFLNTKNIGNGLHYPVPIHLQKAFSELGLKKGDYPVAEDISKRELSLPMFPFMKDEEINYVIDCIKEFYS